MCYFKVEALRDHEINFHLSPSLWHYNQQSEMVAGLLATATKWLQ